MTTKSPRRKRKSELTPACAAQFWFCSFSVYEQSRVDLHSRLSTRGAPGAGWSRGRHGCEARLSLVTIHERAATLDLMPARLFDRGAAVTRGGEEAGGPGRRPPPHPGPRNICMYVRYTSRLNVSSLLIGEWQQSSSTATARYVASNQPSRCG